MEQALTSNQLVRWILDRESPRWVQISSLKGEAVVGKSDSDSVKLSIEPPKSECVSVSHRSRGGNGGTNANGGWESERGDEGRLITERSEKRRDLTSKGKHRRGVWPLRGEEGRTSGS